jgi:hypothetical protein
MDPRAPLLLAALLLLAGAAPLQAAVQQRKPVEFTPSIHLTYLNDVVTTNGKDGELPRSMRGTTHAWRRAWRAQRLASHRSRLRVNCAQLPVPRPAALA